MSPEKRADHITTDNLNHSGDLDGAMQELPRDGVPSVQELDTGELEQITAPDTSEALILHDDERPEFQERLAALRESHASVETATETEGYIPTGELPVAAEQKKSHRKLYAVIGAAGAAAVTAASLFLLPKGENNDKSNTPAPTQPVASAEATPGNSTPTETAAPAAETDTTQTLEFEAGQSDTALAQDFIAGLAKWNNAGGNEVYAYFETIQGQTVQQAAAEYSKKQQQPYIDSFFDKKSISSPDVATYINTMEAANTQTLMYDLLTDPALGNSNDRLRVMHDLYSPVEHVATTGEARTLRFTVKSHSNYKDTFYANKQTDSDDILYSEYTVTFTPESGTEKITAITVTRHK